MFKKKERENKSILKFNRRAQSMAFGYEQKNTCSVMEKLMGTIVRKWLLERKFGDKMTLRKRI